MAAEGMPLASGSCQSRIIAGVDEVGRGCLFGPVVAAAAILPPAIQPVLAQAGVTDSKRLSPARRAVLYEQIQALAVCSIGIASVAEIDRLNVLQASLLAMRRAVQRLTLRPACCLVDGNQLIPELGMAQKTLVKGDQRSLAIAAASIVAKVWRDRLIVRLSKTYPHYDLASNKGYGTPKHRAGLAAFGLTRYHRRSFSACQVTPSSPPVAEQVRLF